MGKIKILRDTVCGGRPVKTGDIVDASEADARVLILLGKAVEFHGEPPKKRGRPPKKKDDED